MAVNNDASRWAVQFPPADGEQFGCSGIYDPATGTVLARSCDVTVWSFSPDGQLVTSARGDNAQWGSLEVLDLDLKPVSTFEPPEGMSITGWGWQDPTHLLVTTSGTEAGIPFSIAQVDALSGLGQNPFSDADTPYVVSE